MADSKTILILGGGVGGVATARALRKRLPKMHRVVLVDRERDHVFAPSLLWLMVGQRTADAITRPLERLARKGIDVRIGNVEHIDPDRRIVTVAGHALSADYLVITLGADLCPESIPGLAQAGHNFYTCSGAQSLRTALESLRSGRIVVLTAAPAYKCPAAPYEGAMLIDGWFRKQGLRDRVQIEIYAAEPAPMGVAGPHVSSAVTDLLAAKGIPYHPEHQVTAVDADRKRLTFANGVQVDFDLLAYVPPHRAPAVIRDSGLTAESGWMSVDRHTLHTRWPDVYAIGDVVSIPLALGKPLPKAGAFAHKEAGVVAENIAHAIAGQVQSARFDGYAWDSPEALALVRQAAGADARLVACEGVERFDILPLLVATDGAIAHMGFDGRRLRPNIVIGGVSGLEERAWPGRRLRIGDAVISVAQLRGRCVMTTYDPDTLTQDPNVLKSIVRELGGTMALDCAVVSGASVRVGAPVVLEP